MTNSPLNVTGLAPGAQLPLTSGPVRFAVGDADGQSSNSWRIWSTTASDVYLACRDNMQEVKVSLHASERWRMAYTSEALSKTPELVAAGENRAWHVWDKPPPILPGTVAAFRLIFPSSEMALGPEHRQTKIWKNTLMIEPATTGDRTSHCRHICS